MIAADQALCAAFGYRNGTAEARAFRAALCRLVMSAAPAGIGQLAGAPSLTPAAAASLRLPELIAPVLPVASAILAGHALAARERAAILAQLGAIESNSFVATVSTLGARYQREGGGRILLLQLQSGLDCLLTQTEAPEAGHDTLAHPVQGPVVGSLTAGAMRALYGQAGFLSLFKRPGEGMSGANLFGRMADPEQAASLLRKLPPFTAGMLLAGTHVFTNSAWHQPGNPQIARRQGGWFVGKPDYVGWDVAGVAAAINGLAISALEIATRNATPSLAAPELATAMTIHVVVLGQALAALEEDVAALAGPSPGDQPALGAVRMLAQAERKLRQPPPSTVHTAAAVDGVATLPPGT